MALISAFVLVCGCSVSDGFVLLLSQELGLTRQKMYKMAVNRDEERVAEFIASLAGVAHEKLVFLDEARVDHRCCNRLVARVCLFFCWLSMFVS